MEDSKAKVIYCPICGRRVLRYDGKTTMNLSSLCRKCNKLVCYYPEDGTVVVKSKPNRISTSGKRYW